MRVGAHGRARAARVRVRVRVHARGMLAAIHSVIVANPPTHETLKEFQ